MKLIRPNTSEPYFILASEDGFQLVLFDEKKFDKFPSTDYIIIFMLFVIPSIIAFLLSSDDYLAFVTINHFIFLLSLGTMFYLLSYYILQQTIRRQIEYIQYKSTDPDNVVYSYKYWVKNIQDQKAYVNSSKILGIARISIPNSATLKKFNYIIGDHNNEDTIPLSELRLPNKNDIYYSPKFLYPILFTENKEIFAFPAPPCPPNTSYKSFPNFLTARNHEQTILFSYLKPLVKFYDFKNQYNRINKIITGQELQTWQRYTPQNYVTDIGWLDFSFEITT